MTKTLRRKAAPAANGLLRPKPLVSAVAAELQSLQRQRSVVMKSRIMQANRLQAIIAGTMGYRSGLSEKERRKKFREADQLIQQIARKEVNHSFESFVHVTLIGINAFLKLERDLEKHMEDWAAKLPVASWVEQREQLGFGLFSLAKIIGETGDLSNYSNPGKVWRRLGCAPWSFDGKTLMGATWRGGKEGKLPASEWEAFGYSPRRRSIAYLIGDGIVKQNGNGPYRKRYNEEKSRAHQQHPKWSDQRCHRHAMLLATKMLLKRLWEQWTGR